MLAFKDLKIKVGGRLLFESQDFELKGGVIALVGRNGVGKSTLLKTATGLHKEFEGKIMLNDKPINAYTRNELAKEISIVHAKNNIFGNHSGRDVLLLGRLPYQNVFAKTKKDDLRIVNQIIEELDLASIADLEFSSLSDGEKQLIMIGKALAQETKVILLDEPGAFLDLVNRFKLKALIKRIATEQRKLILYSTHDIQGLESQVNHVLLITQKKLIMLNDPHQFESTILSSFGLKSDEI
ncbi:ABC transporter ATP-binding protein [Crocinitomix algicola]|uniref:ABC transporter ATP-binding protein n=1 Tax=Crocinitomix algicola TaxID=1740263 RepID=UPI0008728319|nr:ABC transporter ATP-binding protein [Crocinitomix algicola]